MAETGTLLGGLGLLLLGLTMMTDGLKLAAGSWLTNVLEKSTSPPFRGVVTGTFVTAVAQSSSAVTVATIGFVNAGLMSLGQAIAVIFGTNIGTTVTGWLVSILGFEIKIAAFALPMIGLGVAGKLVFGATSRGGVGAAVLGFGLFFLGLDFLKDGFGSLQTDVNLQFVSDFGALGVVLGIVIGFVITTLAQSSSAAIAIVLMAAQSGTILLPTAAAMVIGANIGTTSTALIATIGATPNARRVAMAHVIFNALTGAVALVFLIASLPFVEAYKSFGAPATFLAIFHTGFNLLGVALVWPFQERLAAFLGRRFKSRTEDLAKSQFIDQTLTATPSLAVQALAKEVERINGFVRDRLAGQLRKPDKRNDSIALGDAIRSLVAETYRFGGRVQRERLTSEDSSQLTALLRASQYLLEASQLVEGFASLRQQLQKLETLEEAAPIRRYVQAVLGALTTTGQISESHRVEFDESYHSARAAALALISSEMVRAHDVNNLLDALNMTNRAVARLQKAETKIAEQEGTSMNGDSADVAMGAASAQEIEGAEP